MDKNEIKSDVTEHGQMLLRPAHVAKILGVSDRMARYLMQNGYIRSRLFGTELRTSRGAVECFVALLFDPASPLGLESISGTQYGSTLEISKLIINPHM